MFRKFRFNLHRTRKARTCGTATKEILPVKRFLFFCFSSQNKKVEISTERVNANWKESALLRGAPINLAQSKGKKFKNR